MYVTCDKLVVHEYLGNYTVHCIMVQCSTVQYIALWYNAVLYSTLHYGTIQYRCVGSLGPTYGEDKTEWLRCFRGKVLIAVQYSTVQYSKVQYSTVSSHLIV